MATVTLRTVTPALLTASEAALYTAPSSGSVIVTEIILCNTDSSARLPTIWFKPSASAGTDAQKILDGTASGLGELGAGETRRIPLGTFLSANAVISGLASTTNVIAVRISVVEIT